MKTLIKLSAGITTLLFASQLFSQDERLVKEWSKTSMSFIENKGQFVDADQKPLTDVFYVGKNKEGAVMITDKGLRYILTKRTGNNIDPTRGGPDGDETEKKESRSEERRVGKECRL